MRRADFVSRVAPWCAIAPLSVVAVCSLLFGCDSAKVANCGTGDRIAVGGDQFCLYDASTDPRMRVDAADFVCPRQVPHAIELDGARVCSSRPLERTDLPADVCAMAPRGCDAPSADGGPDLDAAMRDAGGDASDAARDAFRTDAGPLPGGPLIAFQAFDLTGPFRSTAWLVSVDDLTIQRSLTDELDTLLGEPAIGTRDVDVGLSRNGRWLVVATARFGCTDAGRHHCLAVAPVDAPEMLEPIDIGGGERAIGVTATISDDGETVVYAEENLSELRRVSREGATWSAPVSLTSESPYAHASSPTFDVSGMRVVFSCGDQPYIAYGVCDVAVDGSGFASLLRPEDGPDGTPGHTIAYPREASDGSYVFSADWPGVPLVFRHRPGAGAPVRLSSQRDRREEQGCVLLDGRVVTWSPDPDELVVYAPDGTELARFATPPVGEDQLGVLTSCGG